MIQVPATELHAISETLSPRKTVLLIGNDAALLYSRRLLLERAGLGVVGLSSSQALRAVDPACNIALLCRSVSLRDAERIAQMLHLLRPAMPVLRFAGNSEILSDSFTAVLRNSVSPSLFLAVVERLLHPHAPFPRDISRGMNA